LHADQVVLATGYLPPGDPSQLLPYKDHLRYLSDPWEEGVFGRIERSDSVLLIGTGLTMVDMVLSLSRRGHTGKMIARSRRGLLPQPHRQGRPAEMKFEDLEISHVRNAVIHLMRDAGEEWRASMDGLRPFTEMLWQSLSWTDRRRFIKRLRPFWDVHRHRMPESVAAAIEALRSQGRLDIGSGTLRSVNARVDGFEVSFGGKHAETVSADWILNCTGPALDMQAAKLPLLESAVQLGLAEYDPLGLGLMVDAEGRTEPSGRIWALGPICRGCRWESTAIPEIRAQAARLSDGIFLTPLP
jgi:uncharacterized NAD(P)/FAD-binding protein YdhS